MDRLGRPAALAPGSRHPIPVRDPRLAFDAVIPRHWLGGFAPATHFFNGMNLVFPDGERFFIGAVRDSLPGLRDDDGLRAQVQGFTGQEGRHAHEHQRYFQVLRGQGYEIDRFLARFERFCRWIGRLPAPLRLAMTAGAEHYTATFGAFALGDPLVLSAHPVMRRLVVWHATEEIEHKAVAFDVLRATHPSYALRMLGFLLATLALFGWTLAGTRMLLRQEAIPARELRRQGRELRRRDGGRLPRMLWGGIRRYLRPGFHPNQSDELPLAYARMAEAGLDPAGRGLSAGAARG
jgi:predicted metal-dependent hydrolase